MISHDLKNENSNKDRLYSSVSSSSDSTRRLGWPLTCRRTCTRRFDGAPGVGGSGLGVPGSTVHRCTVGVSLLVMSP